MTDEHSTLEQRATEDLLGLVVDSCTITSDLSVDCWVTVHHGDETQTYKIDSKSSVVTVTGKCTEVKLGYQGMQGSTGEQDSTGYIWPDNFDAKPSSVVNIVKKDTSIITEFTADEGKEGKYRKVTLLEKSEPAQPLFSKSSTSFDELYKGIVDWATGASPTVVTGAIAAIVGLLVMKGYGCHYVNRTLPDGTKETEFIFGPTHPGGPVDGSVPAAVVKDWEAAVAKAGRVAINRGVTLN